MLGFACAAGLAGVACGFAGGVLRAKVGPAALFDAAWARRRAVSMALRMLEAASSASSCCSLAPKVAYVCPEGGLRAWEGRRGPSRSVIGYGWRPKISGSERAPWIECRRGSVGKWSCASAGNSGGVARPRSRGADDPHESLQVGITGDRVHRRALGSCPMQLGNGFGIERRTDRYVPGRKIGQGGIATVATRDRP